MFKRHRQLVLRLLGFPVLAAAIASPLLVLLGEVPFEIATLVLVQLIAAYHLPAHLPRRGVVTYRVQRKRTSGLSPAVRTRIFDGIERELREPKQSMGFLAPRSDLLRSLKSMGIKTDRAEAALTASLKTNPTSEAEALRLALRHIARSAS